METFTRVTGMLEAALTESTPQTQADKHKQTSSPDKMPPTSHTLMDLVITLSIYLPRESFPTLFSLAAAILPQTLDPQLQKKAYKLIPRLAGSPNGLAAVKDRNPELQELLINSASSASSPSRRDRLAATAVVITQLPSTSLHFIPSILSEVVISAKEVNEKARTAAFDLLVLMGRKMAEGGIIAQSKIPHHPADAPDVQASLEEFFTMVSAGLAGTTPHMISASITALTRILYEFRTQLADATLEDLVATMDLFLTSSNREIVRSVLGFVKVAVISLPDSIIRPRLPSLVPGLMGWSREHKARFRAKVRHILERMIRRLGIEIVEKNCPKDDLKFIHNIKKTKERSKRKKEADAGAEGDSDKVKRRGKFENELDEVVYGSESDDTGSDGDSISNDEAGASSKHKKGSRTYIIEDEDEPLDLLDRKALGNISSTKPVKFKPTAGTNGRARNKAKTDLDGKLVFGDDDGDDALMLDETAEPGDGSLQGGINAYVDAIKGRDAVQRGRGGRLKFINRREKADKMDVDDEDERPAKKSGRGELKVVVTSGGRVGKHGLEKRRVSGGRVFKSARARGVGGRGRR